MPQVAAAKRDYSLDSVSYDAWSVREPVVAAMKSAALTWVRAAPPPSLATSHPLVLTSCQPVSTSPSLNATCCRYACFRSMPLPQILLSS